jgi:hypothetical protein
MRTASQKANRRAKCRAHQHSSAAGIWIKGSQMEDKISERSIAALQTQTGLGLGLGNRVKVNESAQFNLGDSGLYPPAA